MALLEEQPKLGIRYLIGRGIPYFLLAVILSMIVHLLAHLAVNLFGSHPTLTLGDNSEFIAAGRPVSALSGTVATIASAIIFFRYSLHHPENLFYFLMAFVNAAIRLPEYVIVFAQMLMYKKTDLVSDESISLLLIALPNPTIPIVILCGASILLGVLTIIIVHDSRNVPYKWGIALGLFLLLQPMESFGWRLLTSVF